ncbi:putative phage-related endonuclease [Sphingomonas sp. F9_3S_D5_B_2]
MNWPTLPDLQMPPARRVESQSYLGGSDANIVFSGNRDKISRLWLEKRGEVEPEDLSSSLAVLLGSWTEAFNRQWFEKLTGESVARIGDVQVCTEHSWRRCTLDGFIDARRCVWEAKHTNPFCKPEEVLERYMPQLQHNMAVLGVERAILSVIFGNHRYETFEVAADWVYQQELLEAETAFWDCVISGSRPVPAAVAPAPRPIATREVCLDRNNAWAAAAVDWLQYRQAAKAHAEATNQIKGLVEEDVRRAFGHGVEAKRSKSGALTIRELA